MNRAKPVCQYGLNLVTAPSVEPIDVSTAKSYLRVEVPDDDVLIQTMIEAARRQTENKLNRSFINTTWKLSIDEFPDGEEPILTPNPPLSATSSNVAITYTNTSGVSTTLASSNYQIDATSEPGRIFPRYGGTWPETRSVPNAVQIQFVSGYGSAADTVPGGIRQYMLRLIADQYENREVVAVGTIVTEYPMLDGLLDPYRWTL